MYILDAINKGGGLCLPWNEEFRVTIILKNRYTIRACNEYYVFSYKRYLHVHIVLTVVEIKMEIFYFLFCLCLNLSAKTADIGSNLVRDLIEIFRADERMGGRSVVGSSSRN